MLAEIFGAEQALLFARSPRQTESIAAVPASSATTRAQAPSKCRSRSRCRPRRCRCCRPFARDDAEVIVVRGVQNRFVSWRVGSLPELHRDAHSCDERMQFAHHVSLQAHAAIQSA